tara:strand:- start:27 stop:1034 length:1008 start_codon:yes stop_codon:yes gene_type:complete
MKEIEIVPGQDPSKIISANLHCNNFIIKEGNYPSLSTQREDLTIEGDGQVVVSLGFAATDWTKEGDYFKRITREKLVDHHMFGVVEFGGEAYSRVEDFDHLGFATRLFYVDPETNEVYINPEGDPGQLLLVDWKDAVVVGRRSVLVNLSICHGVEGVELRHADHVSLFNCRIHSITTQGILGGREAPGLTVMNCAFRNIGKRYELHQGEIRENNKDHAIYYYGDDGYIAANSMIGIAEHQVRHRYELHIWGSNVYSSGVTIADNDIEGTVMIAGGPHRFLNNTIRCDLSDPVRYWDGAIVLDDGGRRGPAERKLNSANSGTLSPGPGIRWLAGPS